MVVHNHQGSFNPPRLFFFFFKYQFPDPTQNEIKNFKARTKTLYFYFSNHHR